MSLRPFFATSVPALQLRMFVKWKLAAHTSGQRMHVQSTVQDPSTIVNLGIQNRIMVGRLGSEGLYIDTLNGFLSSS